MSNTKISNCLMIGNLFLKFLESAANEKNIIIIDHIIVVDIFKKHTIGVFIIKPEFQRTGNVLGFGTSAKLNYVLHIY